jgi:hypothetical protein
MAFHLAGSQVLTRYKRVLQQTVRKVGIVTPILTTIRFDIPTQAE